MNKDDYDYERKQPNKKKSFNLGLCWCDSTVNTNKTIKHKPQQSFSTNSNNYPNSNPNSNPNRNRNSNKSSKDKQSHIKNSYKSMYNNANRSSSMTSINQVKKGNMMNMTSTIQYQQHQHSINNCHNSIESKQLTHYNNTNQKKINDSLSMTSLNYHPKDSINKRIYSGELFLDDRKIGRNIIKHMHKTHKYEKNYSIDNYSLRAEVKASKHNRSMEINNESIPIKIPHNYNRHSSFDSTPILQSKGDYCDIISPTNKDTNNNNKDIDLPLNIFNDIKSISSIHSSIMSHDNESIPKIFNQKENVNYFLNENSSQTKELNRILKFINDSQNISIKSINSSVNYNNILPNSSRNYQLIPKHSQCDNNSAIVNSFTLNSNQRNKEHEYVHEHDSAWTNNKQSLETSLSTKGKIQSEIDPKLKELYLKLGKKEEDLKVITEKLRIIEGKNREVHNENNKLLCLINREEAERELLQHMLNYLSTYNIC